MDSLSVLCGQLPHRLDQLIHSPAQTLSTGCVHKKVSGENVSLALFVQFILRWMPASEVRTGQEGLGQGCGRESLHELGEARRVVRHQQVSQFMHEHVIDDVLRSILQPRGDPDCPVCWRT